MSDLEKRMKEAGMLSIHDVMHNSAFDRFSANTSVTDMKSFKEWLYSKREEFLRMQARMQLNGEHMDDMFEWVVSHNAVFGEVIANLKQAQQGE